LRIPKKNFRGRGFMKSVFQVQAWLKGGLSEFERGGEKARGPQKKKHNAAGLLNLFGNTGGERSFSFRMGPMIALERTKGPGPQPGPYGCGGKPRPGDGCVTDGTPEKRGARRRIRKGFQRMAEGGEKKPRFRRRCPAAESVLLGACLLCLFLGGKNWVVSVRAAQPGGSNRRPPRRQKVLKDNKGVKLIPRSVSSDRWRH